MQDFSVYLHTRTLYIGSLEQEGKENTLKRMKNYCIRNSRSTYGRFRLLALTLRVAVFLAGNVESNQDRTQGSQLWGPSQNGLCGELLGEGHVI